jgi:adenosine kinase
VTIAVTGSMAFDYIMSFPGKFAEHILPEHINVLSVSFLVDSLRRERGGCAGNIVYNLALLGIRPLLLATVGKDSPEYIAGLREHGVDTSGVIQLPNEYTSSFFVSTDKENNQIASFYTGAMAKAGMISFHNIDYRSIEYAIISPNDPAAMVKYTHECHELGIPYIYDPSQQLPRLAPADVLFGIEGSKILIVNDYEFGMIKNITGKREEEIRSLTDTLIVTLGENGSMIYPKDADPVKVPAAHPRRIAEPTGVGDAYRAGLVFGLCQGFSWDICGKLGSIAAIYVLEQHGTQRHHYNLNDFTLRYFEQYGEEPALKKLLTTKQTPSKPAV